MYDLSLNILTHWNNIPFVGLQAFARWGVDRASSSDARVQGSNPSHSISKITTFLPKTRWLFGAKCVEPMGLHILGVIPGSDTIKGLGTGYTYRLLRLSRYRLPPHRISASVARLLGFPNTRSFFFISEKNPTEILSGKEKLSMASCLDGFCELLQLPWWTILVQINKKSALRNSMYAVVLQETNVMP